MKEPIEKKIEKVFVTWFMKDYGISYMGLSAILLLENTKKSISPYELIKKWNETIKKVRIYCLFPEFRKDQQVDKKEKNQKEYETLERLYKDYPKLDSIDFWESSRLMPFNDQLKWFEKHWENNYQTENLDLNSQTRKDLTNVLRVVKKSLTKIIKENENREIIINLYNTPTEFQLACYILAEEPLFSKRIKFYKFFDDKETKINDQRILKNAQCIEVSTTPLSDYYKTTEEFNHETHNKIFKKLHYFVNEQQNLFTILLIGPRGVGKTEFLKRLQPDKKNKLVMENCAYFPDNNFTESKLFGAKKGAYTGCNEDKEGAFKLADGGGILFLDEIHHLNKAAQAKLLTALQTDHEGNFTYKRMGDQEEQKSRFQLICATNLTLDELKNKLSADFFDRIAQRIIEIPSIDELNKREILLKKVWTKMNFKMNIADIPEKDMKHIYRWLEKIPLPGNYRSLQQIAISIFDYINDKKNILTTEGGVSAYVKNEYEKRLTKTYKMLKIKIPIENEINGDKLIKYAKKEIANLFLKKYKTKSKTSKVLCIARTTLDDWLNCN